MEVLILTSHSEKPAVEAIGKAICNEFSEFAWTIVTDKKFFIDKLGVFKISILADADAVEAADLTWPLPSVFLKSKKKKEDIWMEVKTKIIPILKTQSIAFKKIALTDSQLQQLMNMITESKVSFTLDHPDGFIIGVNTKENVDLSISTGDLAGMLAASWLFGAKVLVQNPNNQGKDGVK